MLENLKL